MAPASIAVALRLALACATAVALAAGCSDDAPAAAGTPASAAAPAVTLAPDEVASIDGALPLTWADLDRYLGTVYARLPEGEAALLQLVTESVIEREAAAAGIEATDAEIAALEARLEAQARQASNGERGLRESLGESVTADDLRVALRLQALHERLVRAQQPLPDDVAVPSEALQSWLAARLPGDSLERLALDDAGAARWPEGEISKAQVGRRLRSSLPREDVSGVLTEMLGVLLVRREAARLDLSLTPAEATREVLDRNAALQDLAGMSAVSYDQFVQTVQKRSLEELLQTDRFGTEVLLRMISERRWTDDQARAEWEGQGGASGDWEQARTEVWKGLRERCYRELFEESRIVRRF